MWKWRYYSKSKQLRLVSSKELLEVRWRRVNAIERALLILQQNETKLELMKNEIL